MKTAIVALALAAALSGCGSDPGDDVAGQDPTPTPTTPSAAPTGPPWPEFPHDDYTFVYSHRCYCGNWDVRIKVTVVDGEAVEATYAEAGGDGSPGTHAGDPALAWEVISIDEMIAQANGDADRVDVAWPAGQDYPDMIAVDPRLNAQDEEIRYDIHRVTVA